MWIPGTPDPTDLFDYIAAGGLLEAVNVRFEDLIWHNVCVPRMGWPPIPPRQLRDAAAKFRAWSIPGGLDKAIKAIDAPVAKDPAGAALIRKYCVPRQPTKGNPARWNELHDTPADAAAMFNYCLTDIESEAAVSAMAPDLSPEELELWFVDQAIARRGIAVDPPAVENCLEIVRQVSDKYTAELVALTDGDVRTHDELAKLRTWLAANGLDVPDMTADTVRDTLERDDLPAGCRRALEIRAALASASVKKLDAIARRVSHDGRLRDLLLFCGADRTGRWAGRGGPFAPRG